MSEYFSSLRMAAASAAEPAHDALLLKYKAATVSVTVTSQVAQRPSCHGMSVNPSGHFPSDLRIPCGSLMEGNPPFDNERQITSFTKWWRCASTIKRESPYCQLVHCRCKCKVDTAQLPTWGQQLLSVHHYYYNHRLHEEIGTAWSQSPLWSALTTKSFTQWYWVVWISSRVWKTMESNILWLPTGSESSLDKSDMKSQCFNYYY